MKGLFNLDNYNEMTDTDIIESACDDIGNMLIEESGDHEIPENPSAKMEGDTTNSLPGGEQPATRPKDETKIMTGNGTEINEEVYNKAMKALQNSFKEATEIINLLSNCKIVESTVDEAQDDFTEAAIQKAYEDGPYFEKVDRGDKDDIKDITKAIRTKVKDLIKAEGYKFATMGSLTKMLHLEAYAWQIVGIAYVEPANSTVLVNHINEELKDELGEYKLLHSAMYARIIDILRTKFNFRNSLWPYVLVVDRKLPSELKKMDTEGKKDAKAAVNADKASK